MIDPKSERRFSDHPYSDVSTDSERHPPRAPRWPQLALGVLCADAQADGVPCFELGRDCETCERAYSSWVESDPEPG